MAKKDTKEVKSSVPNLEHVVRQVRDSQMWDFSTKEGLCEYQNTVVVALHDNDANFGQLSKSEGQNHCVDPAGNRCATDVALYKPSGQVIDFIASAGYAFPPGTPYEDQNAVTWHVGPIGEYTEDKWFAPTDSDGNTSGGGGSEEGGEDMSAITEQLNRMESTLAEMKLYLSNMNDQMALGFGEVNKIRADQNPPYAGELPRQGNTLTLNAQK